uniref:MATA-HMG n=1 Tax=Rhizophagus irregularis TaxID=588596 RepID=A0A1B1EV41_9GLOM|nr:MATA-HMG [Rhizophagus irregularis]
MENKNNNNKTIDTIDKNENLKILDDDNNNTNLDDIEKFMNEIRPLYPPLITPELLMPKPFSSNSSRKLSSGINYKRKKESNVKFPNAFIAYRMEFCRQLKNKRMCLTMQDVSYFASRLWKKEPCDVKKTYTQLANDAKLLYEKRKKELLLIKEKQQQIENENIMQQQLQQQSNSINISSSSNSLDSSLFQENTNLMDMGQIPQIFSSSLEMNSTYNIPATDPCNLVLFNNFLPPFEDFNIQPSIVPQNYFSPGFFHYMI